MGPVGKHLSVSVPRTGRRGEGRALHPPASTRYLGPMERFIDGLTLTEPLVRALVEHGIERPTPVQEQALAPILAGQDVVLHSGTGTGKTLAYLLPLLQRLRETQGRGAVIAPGVELAMQVVRVTRDVKDPDLSVGAAVSTTNLKRQRKRVNRSTDLVVGTPDRMADLMQRGTLKGVRTLVLDEPDPILVSRAGPALTAMLSRSEPRLQLIVATATLSPRSLAFFEQFLPDAVRIDAPEAPLRDNIVHCTLRVPGRTGREVVLARFLQENKCERAMVFVSDPRNQSHLYSFLTKHNLSTATLSRQGTKQQRQSALAAFRRGAARILLVTDATARGLDVPNVGWVFHYDRPSSREAYAHRAGRTGRAGRQGWSIVLVDSTSPDALRRVERQLGVRLAPFSRR